MEDKVWAALAATVKHENHTFAVAWPTERLRFYRQHAYNEDTA